MGILQRIRKWFGSDDTPADMSDAARLQRMLVEARRQQYTEHYEDALNALTEAMTLAEQDHNRRAIVDITLSRADILIELGDYETAGFILRELRDDSEAREMTAPFAYALCSLGMVAEKKGNIDEARGHYEKARAVAQSITTDGATGRAEAHLADIYLAEGNASYAIYLLEEAMKKLDRSGDREMMGYFYGQLGLAYIANGNAPEGRAKMQHGLDIAMNLKHRAQIRHLSVLLGDQALRDENLEKAQTYYADALRLYTEEIPQDDRYVHLLSRKSLTSLQLGDVATARSHAEAALPVAEKSDDAQLQGQVRVAHALALIATNADSAAKTLEDAIAAYDTLSTDIFLIEALRKQAQLETGSEQIAAYKKAVSAADALPAAAAKVHSNLAESYARQRQFREAIAEWQTAISKYEAAHTTQSIARVHCDIAGMYDLLGDGTLAQREYRTALEQLSRVDDMQTRGIVLANVAAGYSEYGDIESAESFFEEAIAIAKRSRHTRAEAIRRGNYGRLLALTDRPQDALAHLLPARELLGDKDSPVHKAVIENNIGIAHVEMDDYTRAGEHFATAQALLATEDAPRWSRLIQVHEAERLRMQGDDEAAAAIYRDTYTAAKAHKLIVVMIHTLIGQADIAMNENDLATAAIKLDNAEPVAKRQGHRRLLALLMGAHSRLLALQGDESQAKTTWDEAQKLRTIMCMPDFTPDWLDSVPADESTTQADQ